MSSNKVSSTIRYSKPGTLPPIYVAGSFSSPIWEPQEMTCTASEAGEYEFYKEVEVEEDKEYQYKFRVGLGDWWVLNESSPTATDPAGNKNNVLNVQRQKESKVKSENTMDTSQLPPNGDGAQPGDISRERKSPNHTNGEFEDSKSSSDISPLLSLTNPSKFEIEKNDNAATTDAVQSLTKAKNIHAMSVEQANDPTHLVDPLISTNATAADRNLGNLEEPDNVRSTIGSTSVRTSLSHSTDGDIKSTHLTMEPPPNGPDDALAMSPVVDEALIVKNDITNESDQLQNSSSHNLAVGNGDAKHVDGTGHDTDGTTKKVENRHIQVHDAISDPIVARQQSCTPDIAAEVAESAAVIDREQPTPPISDAEAGRIGLRRMSGTPIPEVAATAAEVANTAATLDGEYFHASRDYEGGIGEWHVDFSLPESAKNLSIPERNELKREQAEKERIQNEELLRTPGAKILASRDRYHAQVCKEADSFPRSQETDQIWKDILAAREVAVDEASKQGLRHTDLGDDNRELFGLARITSQLYWCKASQARAFPDGNDPQLEADIAEQEDRLAFYQYRAKIESGELVESNQGSCEEGGENERIESNKDTTTEDIRPNGSGSKNGSTESKPSTSVRNNVDLDESNVKKEDTVSGQKVSNSESKMQEPTDIESMEHDASEDTKEKPLTDSKRANIDGADDKQNKPLEETYESHPELPTMIAGDLLDGAQSRSVPSSVTPVAVGDSQLDNQDEGTLREILTGEDGPSIMVQPATPAILSSKNEPLSSSEDTTKAPAAADNGENQLRKRKQLQSPAGDRPRTPTSMRSDGRDAKSKNFLKAFWRVVFVDWIGGVIMRLCGGNRHKVLTIFALVVFTIGPALYFSS